MSAPTAVTLSQVLKGTWDLLWAVGGLGVFYAYRADLRRPSDGRVAWSAKPEVMYGYILVYFILLYTVIGGLAAGVTKSLTPLVGSGEVFEKVTMGFFVTLFSTALLIFIAAFMPDFSPQRPHRVKPAPLLGFTPKGIMLGFACAMAIVGVSSLGWNGVLTAVRAFGWGDFLQKQDAVGWIARLKGWHELSPLLLGTVVFAPLSEELFYRGAIFATLRGRIGRIGALVLSGVIFGVVHGNVAALVPLSLFGIWLAYLYDTTADLRVPVVIHALFNLNTVCWVLFAPEVLN